MIKALVLHLFVTDPMINSYEEFYHIVPSNDMETCQMAGEYAQWHMKHVQGYSYTQVTFECKLMDMPIDASAR